MATKTTPRDSRARQVIKRALRNESRTARVNVSELNGFDRGELRTRLYVVARSYKCKASVTTSKDKRSFKVVLRGADE